MTRTHSNLTRVSNTGIVPTVRTYETPFGSKIRGLVANAATATTNRRMKEKSLSQT